MTTRPFPLAEVLTVITGRLMPTVGMPAVCDLLEYLADGPVMTHQIGRAAEACGPRVLEQCPQLADAVPPPEGAELEQLISWLAEMEAVHGTEVPLAPLPPGAWEPGNPLAELVERFGPDRVITVITESD